MTPWLGCTWRSMGVLDARLQQPLAQVPNGRAKRQGIAVGEAVVWPITC
jgi:hypothetical protein